MWERIPTGKRHTHSGRENAARESQQRGRIQNDPSKESRGISVLLLIGTALALAVTATVGILLMNQADATRSDGPPTATLAQPASFTTVAGGVEANDGVANAIGFTNGTVSVTRSASVSVEPDHAVLDLGVEAIADTVAGARQSAAERVTAMLAAIKEAGVDDDDIATSMFEIYPRTEWVESRTRITGYAVRNGMKVTVQDLEITGSVIDAAAEAAGDQFFVSGIRFALRQIKRKRWTKRRVLAALDARRVAELHGATLGFVLGPVVEMVEYGGVAPIGAQFDARVEAAQSVSFDTPIVPGDVDVSVTVQVKFAIIGAVAASGQ